MPSKKRNYWNLGMSEWLKNILFGTKTIVVRARNKVGRYVKDDKSTPENEAFTKKTVKVKPKKKAKKKAKKKTTKKK